MNINELIFYFLLITYLILSSYRSRNLSRRVGVLEEKTENIITVTTNNIDVIKDFKGKVN